MTGRISRATAAWYSRNASLYDRVVTHGFLRLATAGGGRDVIAELAASVACRGGEATPVLDVPTGTGEYLPFLPQRVVGADLAEGMLHEAANRVKGVPLVRADVFSLPFGDASFGTAFTSLGLQLLPKPRQAVAEMSRVLRPGGKIYGAVPVGMFSRFVTLQALRAALKVPGISLTRLARHRWLVVFEATRDC